MSFKDERGHWSFSCRKVFEIVFNCRMPVVQSTYGSGEMERTGEYVEEDRTMHVLADSEAEARLAWWHRHKHDGKNAIKSCEIICSIDSEISIRNR